MARLLHTVDTRILTVFGTHEACQRLQELRGLLKLLDQSGQIDGCSLGFLRGRFNLSEVWLGIKGLLKPLRIDLAVFIQNTVP